MAATKSEFRDGVIVVRFVDTELSDEVRIRDIGAELIELGSQPNVRQMLLNFEGVTFMSSAMLGQLAILTKRCLSHQVGLKMCNVDATMREVLRIVRLDTLADILGDEKEALKAFRRERAHKDSAADAGSESDTADAYRAAASKGDAEAQFRLARCYENGRGVVHDFAEARKWYEKSARQGCADAQHALATCYAYGMQVPQNYDEAIKWYRKAAEQGHADSEYAMGMNYAYGIGVKADLAQAKKWYRKAADQGHVKAKEALEQLDSDTP
ncbi:MAG: STAS domain-containing protein [Candidatus Anammoximicrobium sp.]|nr:STAS domain-containing protein [Candidatus Anammoximicrobium sp.]